MFQTIQCVNKPRGASGSSTIKATDFASLATPLIFSSGFTFAPLHVNFAGMSPPAWKAELTMETEEAAFRLRIAQTEIARANEIGFIEQTLASSGCGQGNECASASGHSPGRLVSKTCPGRNTRSRNRSPRAHTYRHPERKRGPHPRPLVMPIRS